MDQDITGPSRFGTVQIPSCAHAHTCSCTPAETVAQAAWMLLVTYFNLIHASWTDPGIIPRGEKAEVEPDGEYVA